MKVIDFKGFFYFIWGIIEKPIKINHEKLLSRRHRF